MVLWSVAPEIERKNYFHSVVMNIICPLCAGLLLDAAGFALDNKEGIMWEISWLFNNSPGKNSEANSGDKHHLCRGEQSVNGYGKSLICVCAICSPYPKMRYSGPLPKKEIFHPQPTLRVLDHIMDMLCFISRSSFGVSREKVVLTKNYCSHCWWAAILSCLLAQLSWGFLLQVCFESFK